MGETNQYKATRKYNKAQTVSRFKVKVKSILFPQLHKHIAYTWGTETLLGLFVPSFDTYMIILLDNPYAGVTLISKNK